MEGTIVAVTDKEIVMNIGFKSEGIIPSNEFRDDEIKIGQEVEVFIVSVEDQNGQLILSRRRAKHLRSWEAIEDSMEKDRVLQGHVMRRTKGGLL